MSQQIEAIPPLVYSSRLAGHPNPPPTRAEWKRHFALFLATAITATLAGASLAVQSALEPALEDPVRWFDYLLYIPHYYLESVWLLLREALRHPALLAQGVIFAASLLAILAAHEAGHYLACRRYGVNATLPFFLPAPPLFLAGTFGAFIKIKSPIPSRRALFDIGLAGPLAGFVVALPVAVAGLLTLSHIPPSAPVEGLITFHDPLLFRALAFPLGIRLENATGNSFYFAAWIGLLVTSLNLFPVGQLDGGHAVYALLGRRTHYWLGRFAFLAMCGLTYLGLQYYGSASGVLYSLLLLVVLRAGHPRVEDEEEPLGRGRVVVGLVTLAVFILCFLPFPITIS